MTWIADLQLDRKADRKSQGAHGQVYCESGCSSSTPTAARCVVNLYVE